MFYLHTCKNEGRKSLAVVSNDFVPHRIIRQLLPIGGLHHQRQQPVLQRHSRSLLYKSPMDVHVETSGCTAIDF